MLEKEETGNRKTSEKVTTVWDCIHAGVKGEQKALLLLLVAEAEQEPGRLEWFGFDGEAPG